MKKFDGAFFDYSPYEIAFEDKFDTYSNVSELDHNPITGAGKFYRYPYEGPLHGWGAELYDPNQVSFLLDPYGTKRGLKLTATEIQPTTLSTGRVVEYKTGMIRTAIGVDTCPYRNPSDQLRMGFEYGVFELRAKLAANRPGVWPVFWLFSGRTEIDIIDNLKLEPSRIIQSAVLAWDLKPSNIGNPNNLWAKQTNYTGPTPAAHNGRQHYYKDDLVLFNGEVYQARGFVRRIHYENIDHKEHGAMLNEGYNTYTMVWNPTEIAFFLNGYKVYSFTRDFTQTTSDVAYVIVSMQMHNWAPTNGDIQNNPYTTDMEIEYIRVYKPIGYVSPPAPDYIQNPQDYNFRFHDKTTLFNNLSSINYTFPTDVILEKAASDLILAHDGKKVYFRSDNNRLDNFYFADPDSMDTDPTEKWNFGSLDFTIPNVMGNVVHHPTEERLFYKGLVFNQNNNFYYNNRFSVFSFYFHIDTNAWKNEDLGLDFNIRDAADNIVVSPDGRQVYYRNSAGYINYFEKNVADEWEHFSTNGSPTAIGNLIHSPTQSKRLYYLGLGNLVYELQNSNGVWLGASPIGNTANVAGDIIHSPIGQNRLFYRSIDYKLYMLTLQINGWILECLNDLANVSANVRGFLVHNPNSRQIYYIGRNDNRLYNFYFDGSAWRHGVLDSSVNNVSANKYCISASGKKIFYKGTDNKLHLFYFLDNVSGVNGRWYARSMKDESSDNVAGNIALSSFGKPFYIGTDGGIWNYYDTWSGNYDWEAEDISID